MKLSTLKSKVKESLVAANDAAIELNNSCKVAANIQLSILDIGLGNPNSMHIEFNTAVSKVVDLQSKLTEAKCKVLTNSINYDRELRRVINNIKKCLIFAVIGCVAITFLV